MVDPFQHSNKYLALSRKGFPEKYYRKKVPGKDSPEGFLEQVPSISRKGFPEQEGQARTREGPGALLRAPGARLAPLGHEP